MQRDVTHDTLDDGWATIRIRSELKQSIEALIPRKKRHGVPIFKSVADFVHTACIEELEKQGQKKEVTA